MLRDKKPYTFLIPHNFKESSLWNVDHRYSFRTFKEAKDERERLIHKSIHESKEKQEWINNWIIIKIPQDDDENNLKLTNSFQKQALLLGIQFMKTNAMFFKVGIRAEEMLDELTDIVNEESTLEDYIDEQIKGSREVQKKYPKMTETNKIIDREISIFHEIKEYIVRNTW